MPEASRNDVKLKILGIVEPSVAQITSDIVKNYFSNSPEILRIKAMNGYNFPQYSIDSNNYINNNIKGSFIWGKSTWGLDSVSVNTIINEGEYNPSNRTGVLKRDEFRQ